MESTQLAEYRPEIGELITVEQLPIIRERLELMRDTIQKNVDTALSLAVTEDTIKEVKAVRARLKKDYEKLEKARIEVKKQILSPYEQFEAIYKKCITSVYSPADEKLRRKINEVEDGLKKAKQLEVEGYFKEYCSSKNIDFLSFRQTGIAINLTCSKKSLKTQAKAFVDQVADDLAFISSQENEAEILVEYKKSLNAVQAMTIVTNRHKALAAEQKRLQQAQQYAAEQAVAVQKVEQAVKEKIPAQMPPAPVVTPLSAPKTVPVQEHSEKIFKTTFTVRGTKAQLLSLRRFLLEGGYDFE